MFLVFFRGLYQKKVQETIYFMDGFFRIIVNILPDNFIKNVFKNRSIEELSTPVKTNGGVERKLSQQPGKESSNLSYSLSI
jgi:hypothetical protein